MTGIRPGVGLDREADYAVPRPTKIKMKETKPEKAHRLYRREQRRAARESERISRANGYAVSPPRRYRSRSDSISPPRHPPKTKSKSNHEVYDVDADEEEEGGGRGGEWMGGYGRRAKEELETREWEEKLAWLAGGGSNEDPFGGVTYGYAGSMDGVHIPKRFREAAGAPGPSSSASSNRRKRDGDRDPAQEVDFDAGGPVPPLGAMTEEEYTAWVREGMYRRKHRAELEAAERRRKEKEEKERKKEKEREKASKEEERRLKKLKKQKGDDEERKRKEERGRWKDRWKKLGETGGEVEETELRFDDIPWPVYRSSNSTTTVISEDHLTIDNVRSFLYAVAEDEAAKGGDDLRKVIREAIRSYHPDRFHGRVLPRVREKDRDRVKDAVEKLSRVLNDLAAEGK
ncbi:hypothetical protein IAR55_000658 [Kwoniella newhampshirensis]|uniref:J domain-containing protein n=1 Tax=Kwoniella newhampshirensis TaxID=1651941 RepID=A0AAW0Z7D8_9TREE